MDWGQDLKQLARWLKEQGKHELILSYFGTEPPEVHGLLFQDLFSTKMYSKEYITINSPAPERELLAVSATQLSGVYFGDPEIFSFLQNKELLKRVGHSIFVWDITGDGEVHFQLSLIYLGYRKYREAAREVQRARALGYKGKDIGEVLSRLAFYYFEQGDLKQAEEFYLQAVQVDPLEAAYYNNLGTVYDRQGRERKALKVWKTAIELDPGLAQAYYNLGAWWWKRQKWEKVIYYFQKALEYDPGHAAAREFLERAKRNLRQR